MRIRKGMLVKILIALLLCFTVASQPYLQGASNHEMRENWSRALNSILEDFKIYGASAQGLIITMQTYGGPPGGTATVFGYIEHPEGGGRHMPM